MVRVALGEAAVQVNGLHALLPDDGGDAGRRIGRSSPTPPGYHPGQARSGRSGVVACHWQPHQAEGRALRLGSLPPTTQQLPKNGVRARRKPLGVHGPASLEVLLRRLLSSGLGLIKMLRQPPEAVQY